MLTFLQDIKVSEVVSLAALEREKGEGEPRGRGKRGGARPHRENVLFLCFFLGASSLLLLLFLGGLGAQGIREPHYAAWLCGGVPVCV